MDEIVEIRHERSDSFGVGSTPTFFINGKRMRRRRLEEFEKAFAPLLKS